MLSSKWVSLMVREQINTDESTLVIISISSEPIVLQWLLNLRLFTVVGYFTKPSC